MTAYRAKLLALDGAQLGPGSGDGDDDGLSYLLLGGPGSGNFGHAGRPGEVGGSGDSDGQDTTQREKTGTATEKPDAGTGSGRGVSVPSSPPAGSGGRPEANPEVHGVANTYNKKLGLPPVDHSQYVAVDEPRAGRIADAYDALPVDDSDNPKVREAYAALRKEVGEQWDHITASGMKFIPWTKEGQPYQSSKEMAADVRDNKRMYFFTGGDPHPLLGDKDPKTGLSDNDKFRAVHDYFGHAAGGYGFGARGEENAWRSHSQMLTPAARRALTTETRGQNSWVNFGDQNYHPDGTPKNVPPAERPFATQKVALLPDEFVFTPEELRDLASKSLRAFGRGDAARPIDSVPLDIRRELVSAFEAFLLGGEGSGNFGHAGRPGEVGGSASGSRVPPKPGSTPVPKGMIRAYHYTNKGEEALTNILKEGLSSEYSRGSSYGEPNAIWFSTQKPGDFKHYVEVLLKPEELEGGIGGIAWTIKKDGSWKHAETEDERQQVIDEFNAGGANFAVGVDKVPPSRIVTHSEPWMSTYHQIVNPENPDLKELYDEKIQEIVAGKLDAMANADPKKWGKVIAAVKAKFGPKKLSAVLDLGGAGSGNFGHAGRIGEVGGSGPGGGTTDAKGVRKFSGDEGYDWHERPEMVEYAAKLPKEDLAAIRDYASFSYADINDQLRGQHKPRIINEFVRPATEAEIAAYQPQFTRGDAKDYDPEDPTNKVDDGRIVHPKGKVGWSIQRAVPDLKPVKELEKTAARVNASIRERGHVLEEPVEVKRAAYIPGLSYEDLQSQVGGEIEEKGFTSTMLGDPRGRQLDAYVLNGRTESIYKRTGGKSIDRDEVGTAMRISIVLPKGTKVAAVEPVRRTNISYERDKEGKPTKETGRTFESDKGFRREAEILLGSGARFRVSSVSKGKPIPTSDDGSLRGFDVADVELEYIGGGSSDPKTELADYHWRRRDLGGPGSGNFGHAGRPGEVGGSGEGDGAKEPWAVSKAQFIKSRGADAPVESDEFARHHLGKVKAGKPGLSVEGEKIVYRDESGEPIGVTTIRTAGGERVVDDTAVHPDHRRRGIASQLYEKAAELGHTAGWAENIGSASAKHKLAVTKAVAAGRPVPDEVLADYPALRTKAVSERIIKESGGKLAVLQLRPKANGDVHLETIAVAREAGRGTGTKAMESLTDWADDAGVRLVLSPSEKGYQPVEKGPKTTSPARLKQFYKRFGFVEAKGRHYDPTLSESMYRPPQAKKTITNLGGPGSGNFGHVGRPGEVGGSGEGTGTSRVPKEPGTTPIPQGKIRGYHYTDAMDAVEEGGLDVSKAKGSTYGEPNMIWFSTEKPGDSKDYVEVFLDPKELGIGRPSMVVKRDGQWKNAETPAEQQEALDEYNKGNHNFTTGLRKVSPDRFVTTHRSWHSHYRYLVKDEEQRKAVVAGEYDWGLDDPEYAPAIKAIKAEAEAKSLSERLSLGGEGSGNFGHAGRKGEVGGSAKSDAALASKLSKLKLDPSKDVGSVFGFESQVNQFPKKGKPGLGVQRESVGSGKSVDILTHRDAKGTLRGVAYHYPQDIPPYEQKGNVNILVDPKAQRQGIGTTLLKEADKRWNINFKKQSFTRAGRQLVEGLRRKATGEPAPPKPREMTKAETKAAVEAWYRGEGELPIENSYREGLSFLLGGEGSGNFGHAGRPGEVGGSGPGGGVSERMASLKEKYPIVAKNYARDSGTEMGSIEEHTEDVGREWAKQLSTEDLAGISDRFGSDVETLMAAAIPLHDIGKPDALASREKWKQHEHTIPILQDVLSKEGFSKKDIALATELMNHDMIGPLFRAGAPRTAEQVAQELTTKAKKVGMSVSDFAKLQVAFYQADASAYPYVTQFMTQEPSGKWTFAGNKKIAPIEALVTAKDLSYRERLSYLLGGEGSGNFGHAGRPGEVGGSAEGTGSTGGKDNMASDPEHASERRLEAEAEKAVATMDGMLDEAVKNAQFDTANVEDWSEVSSGKQQEIEQSWKEEQADQAQFAEGVEAAGQEYIDAQRAAGEDVEGIEESDGYARALEDAEVEWVNQGWNNLLPSEKLEAGRDFLHGGDYAPGAPNQWKWDVSHEPGVSGSADPDYLRTKAVSKELVRARTEALMEERGLATISGMDSEMIAGRLWEGWKNSSSSSMGTALQMAVAEELGTHPTAHLTAEDKLAASSAMVHAFTSRVEREGSKAQPSLGIHTDLPPLDKDKLEAVAMGRAKAYVRAQWEATQYLLKKAGVKEVEVYRAVILPTAKLAGHANLTDPKSQRLPNLKLKQNAAASTTANPTVANDWGGVGKNQLDNRHNHRVVVRFRAPAASVLSVPVYGDNVHKESEVVLMGTKGLKWDAYYMAAPSFKMRPLSMSAWQFADDKDDEDDEDDLVVDLNRNTDTHWLVKTPVEKPAEPEPEPASEPPQKLSYRERLSYLLGGEGSGNFGHAGRIGEVGGSAPGKGDADDAPVLKGVDSKANAKAQIDRHLAYHGQDTDPAKVQAAEAELRALPLVHGTSVEGAIGAITDGLKSHRAMEADRDKFNEDVKDLKDEIQEATAHLVGEGETLDWDAVGTWEYDTLRRMGFDRSDAKALQEKIEELKGLEDVIAGTTYPADKKLGLDRFVFMTHGQKHQDYGTVAVIIDNEVIQDGFATEVDIAAIKSPTLDDGKPGEKVPGAPSPTVPGLGYFESLVAESQEQYADGVVDRYRSMIVKGDDYYKVAAAKAGSAEAIGERSRNDLFEVKSPTVPKRAVKGFVVTDIDEAQRLSDALAERGITGKVLLVDADSGPEVQHQLRHIQETGEWDEEMADAAWDEGSLMKVL